MQPDSLSSPPAGDRSAAAAKVASARRRWMLGQFGRAAGVALFIGMLVATMAIVALAITPIEINGQPVDADQWRIGWIAGSVGIALIAAIMVTIGRAPSAMRVATEVDRRFGLRERISSSMAISASDTSSAAQALHRDAQQKAAPIVIASQFPLQPTRVAWLPLAVLPVLLATTWVIEPVGRPVETLSAVDAMEVKQVKTAAEQLKKRIAQQRRQAEAKGLKEAEELFAKMQTQLDKITSSKDMTRKDALIQMNDIKDQIQQRRDRLGSPEQMRRTLAQMKGLESGPAEKVAEQIQKGEFGNAAEEIKKLAEKVSSGKMSESEKKQLAKQVAKMAEQMKQAAAEHEQKKEQLREKIEQAKREGRSAEASEMQQKLNEAEAADAQMQQMQQMAQAMQEAAQAMQEGDQQAAAEAMQEMSSQLGEMGDAMAELEDLQDALGDLSQSKQQMNCKQCGGAGCQSCMGDNFGDGDQPGQGRGRGQGSGDRDEAEDDTGTYESQVRGDVKRGKAVIAGFADGPNRKGVTREEIKNVIEGAIREEGDPLEDQILPRDERDQTRQYFDRLRE